MSFLDELARRCGVPFRFAPLAEDRRAYLIEGAVVLNDALAPERAHWAYCHEAAHLLLGHSRELPHDEAEEKEQEAQANRLAADLLLPEDQFLP